MELLEAIKMMQESDESEDSSTSWDYYNSEREQLRKDFENMRSNHIGSSDYRYKAALKREKELNKLKLELTAKDEGGEVVTSGKLSKAISKLSGLEPIKTTTSSVRGYRPVSSGSFSIENNTDYFNVYFYKSSDKIPELVPKLEENGYNIINYKDGASSLLIRAIKKK